MNIGAIAHRYAVTLFKHALETGEDEMVWQQARDMERAISAHPEISDLMHDKVAIAAPGVMQLLRTAAGGTFCPAMEGFMQLLKTNGRLPYLRLILRDFEQMYLHHKNMAAATITSCAPLSPQMREQIVRLVKERIGEDMLLTEKIDPSLIGGFILEVDGYTLDASARGQLDTIRSQFIQKNRRIV